MQIGGSTARHRSTEGSGKVDRARPRSLYLPPEVWEAGRKRAKKHKMKISRFGWLCCERAAREEAAPAPQPAGHALALSTDEQQRLDADMQCLALFGDFTVPAAGGREETIAMHEVLRFLHLTDSGKS